MFLRGAGEVGRVLAAAKVLAGELEALACPESGSTVGGGWGGGADAGGFLFLYHFSSTLIKEMSFYLFFLF